MVAFEQALAYSQSALVVLKRLQVLAQLEKHASYVVELISNVWAVALEDSLVH